MQMRHQRSHLQDNTGWPHSRGQNAWPWAVAPTPWGTVARAPTFANGWARGGALLVEQQTKKLTKMYWPSRKRSPKRLIVLLEPKSEGERPNFFWRFAPHRCPHFRSEPVPPLSNSVRRHWRWGRLTETKKHTLGLSSWFHYNDTHVQAEKKYISRQRNTLELLRRSSHFWRHT